MAAMIRYVTVGKWNENSYLITDNGEAWLTDPGDEFELLDKEFDAENLLINGIINTPGHFDHIGAVEQFKEKYNLPFYLHSKDKQIVRQGNLYKRFAGSSSSFKTPSIDHILDEEPTLKLGEKSIITHYTPGHTNGSMCFEIEQSLISGDLLFKNTIGRVDLPGGKIDLLKRSVNYVLERFAGYTIYPGHGEPFLLNEKVISTLKKLV